MTTPEPIEPAKIAEQWRNAIRSRFGAFSQPLRDYRRRAAQAQPLTVWLGGPGKGAVLCDQVPILQEILKDDNCTVTFGHVETGGTDNEIEPMELVRIYDLLILVAVSPGTAAEAMELAACKPVGNILKVFLPKEFESGYLAKSLSGPRHRIATKESFFSLEKAQKCDPELALKVTYAIQTHRSNQEQKQSVRSVTINKIEKVEHMENITVTSSSGVNIVNHSTVEQAFNAVKAQHGTATANALAEITKHVESSGNKAGAELLNSYNQELTKREPSKPVLQALWDGICKAVPTVAGLAKACAEIVKLHSGG